MTEKHKKNEKSKISIIIGICLIVVSICILAVFVWEYYSSKKSVNANIELETTSENIVEENTTISEENAENENIEETENEENEKNNKDIKKIGKYKVIGKIIIDKIDLEDVILEETTDTSLNLGLTKLWGPGINKPGNVSITGHNYRIERSELFSNLNQLLKGDTFELEDMNNKRVKYKIYDKYTVDPEDTSSIDQNDDGKREVTLITCTKGAKERIIFKAREM